MRRTKLWAGLDVGVETTSVCIIDDKGQVIQESCCQTLTKDVRHELAAFRRQRFASVILEAGPGTHLARGLRSLGYPVELYEARTLSKFLRARRNKTDAGDAAGIAEAGRIGSTTVSRVYLKDLDGQCLQSLLTIRRTLIRQRIVTKCTLGRIFEQFGGRLSGTDAKGGLQREVQEAIRKTFRAAPPALVSELLYLAEHYDRLAAHQRELDRELTEASKRNEIARRLMEIPGVGPICALNFVAAVGDPHRFSRLSDVGSYFGLTPKLHQSGLTYRMGRISKMGNRVVRALLVQAAVSFLRYGVPDSNLRNWAQRVEQRRGKLRSRVALARKLAVVMLAMWKSGSYYDPTYRVRTNFLPDAY